MKNTLNRPAGVLCASARPTGGGAVAVVAEGAKEPVDLEDDEDDDDEEEEAELAFAVLLEQGKEVAAEASRASSSI